MRAVMGMWQLPASHSSGPTYASTAILKCVVQSLTCVRCHTTAAPKLEVTLLGRIAVAIVLVGALGAWAIVGLGTGERLIVFVVVVALGTGLYKSTGTRKICSACKSSDLVPADTPRAKSLGASSEPK